MDERLKKKLELLGEPTLPARLTAEELFRRMDSGELVLPEEGPLSQTEDDSDRKVIPWIKLMRRGLPIAACLALVVLLSRAGLWDKDFSGGANLSLTSEAPQRAADQTAPAVDDAPAESYRFDADFDADEEETPDPAPRSIAIADESEEEDAAVADAELARQGEAEKAPQSFLESGDSANDSFVSDGRPDTGGDLPPSDTTGNSGFNPDCGAGGNDPDTSNPDTGGGGDWEDSESREIHQALWDIIFALCAEGGELEDLDGLGIGMRGYETVPQDGRMTEVIGYFSFINEDWEEVEYIRVYCSVIWSEDGEQFELKYLRCERGRIKDQTPGSDGEPDSGGGVGGEPNPDTSGTSPDDEWDPDPGTGGGTDYGKNPDVGEESQEGSATDGEQERSEEDSDIDQEEAQEQTDTDQDQEEPQGDASLQPFPPHDPESD